MKLQVEALQEPIVSASNPSVLASFSLANPLKIFFSFTAAVKTETKLVSIFIIEEIHLKAPAGILCFLPAR